MRLYGTSIKFFGYCIVLVSDSEKRAAICAEVIRLLSEERKRKGISMNQLAKLTGLTQPAISILESKQPNPKLDNLLRIAFAMAVDLPKVLKVAIKKHANIDKATVNDLGVKDSV